MTDDLVKRLLAYEENDLVCVEDIKAACDRIEALEARVSELTRHLLVVTDDCWPYLHQHCTIDSIKFAWRRARAALAGEKKDD